MSKIGNIVVAMDTVQETHVSFHDFALILIYCPISRESLFNTALAIDQCN